MRKKKPALLLLSFLAFTVQVSYGATAGGRTEPSLADLKPGRKFEVLQDLSFPVPPMLRLLGEIPLLQVTAGSIGLAKQSSTSEPVCLVTGIDLSEGVPAQVLISKGATIEVSSVEAGMKVHPMYVGPSVAFGVRVSASALKAKLRCYPGKGAKRGAMSIEALEKVFRGKVRLLPKV